MATKTSGKTSGSAPKKKRASAPPPAQVDGATMIASAAAAPLPAIPTHEAIAFRAFELYQSRPHGEGSELHDWLAAERELRAS